MSSQRVQISLLERLDLLRSVFRTALSALITAITAPFPSTYNAPPEYYKSICYAALRAFNNSMSVRQMQFVGKPTDEYYRDFAKSKGFQPETTVLPYGAKGHWLGKKSATKVVICFHGGGYGLPGGPQIDFHWDIQNTSSTDTAAVVVLSYSLAPAAQYPTQLRQAVELVRHIISDAGKKPSNVFLSGDSAGGHLALAVLSHLLHPHPSVAPLGLSEPLGGVLLLSPWVEFETTAPSYTRNRYSDAVGAPAVTKWATGFMGDTAPDNYTHPMRAPQTWWDGLGGVAEEIFIVAGADEILVDDIKNFSKTIEAKCNTLIVQGEIHDQPIVDIALGWKTESSQTKAAKAWFANKLWSIKYPSVMSSPSTTD